MMSFFVYCSASLCCWCNLVVFVFVCCLCCCCCCCSELLLLLQRASAAAAAAAAASCCFCLLCLFVSFCCFPLSLLLLSSRLCLSLVYLFYYLFIYLFIYAVCFYCLSSRFIFCLLQEEVKVSREANVPSEALQAAE